MRGFGPETYGEAFADVYDRWYGALPEADLVVEAISSAATRLDGPILELGIGTGRLALPLADRGYEVVGVDASPAMLELLAAKAGNRSIEVHQCDMSRLDDLPRAGRFAVVFAAFNTLLNLPTSEDRSRCFAGVERLLSPGGRLGVEAVVPGPDPDAGEDHIEIRTLEVDRMVLTVSRRDPETKTVSGHHVELTDGAPVRLRPWQLGYVIPTDLDAEAERAGLALLERTATWDGDPFIEESSSHVSWYERLA